MSYRILFFYLVQIAAFWFALRRGGGPERLVAIMLMAAAIVSSTLPYFQHMTFRHVELRLAAVDFGLLVGLLALACRADRFWPMWVAAFQLLAVSLHAVRAFDATIVPIVYNGLVAKLAYPMIALLVAGTSRHSRRVGANGPERDWSPLVWH